MMKINVRLGRCTAALFLAACAPASGAGRIAPGAGAVELVGEGVLSTAANEYNPSFTPDGRMMAFARSEPDFRNPRILFARLRDGRWSAPEPAPFADPRYGDSDPTFAPDGRTLYFVSDRPAPGRDSARADLDVWRVRREGDRWGAPEHLGPEVNTRAQELGPAWHDGWLYFSSSRGGRARMLDLFRARATGDGFGAAEALAPLNTAASESDAELSPDGTLLTFWSDRQGGEGGDLYLSRRTGDGWSAPVALARANSAGFDFTPEISPDGRWLYFASTRAGAADRGAVEGQQASIYRVPLRSVLP
jgi:dipeptidyl aminopeptidase/acylaminoacyl peptidase